MTNAQIIGYVVTAVTSLIVGLLLQRLAPKAHIVFWESHQFWFKLEAENVLLFTRAITIQNIGRETSQDIEIVHTAKPDFFKIDPPIDFEEKTTPAGEHVIRIPTLGPKELINIEFLAYKTPHEPRLIRSKEGLAQPVTVQLQRYYGKWLNTLAATLMIFGFGLILYWIGKLCTVLYRWIMMQ